MEMRLRAPVTRGYFFLLGALRLVNAASPRNIDQKKISSGTQGIVPPTNSVVYNPNNCHFMVFHASASFTEDARASPTSAQNDQQGCSPLDSKQQEMKDLKVQIVTAKEALQNLNQLENEYVALSSLRGHVCNNFHATGHTKTTCRSPPCSNIKIKDKHPEHKLKVNELQREIKSLESQAAQEEENIKSLASARERAKTSLGSLRNYYGNVEDNVD